MLRLKRADYDGYYNGFNLKAGYWYGEDTSSGEKIATSGWEVGENVAIYHLKPEGWKIEWTDIYSEFQVENIPEISSPKMGFYEWLDEEYGISFSDWDECYSGSQAAEIEDSYNAYYYDGLPKFVQIFISKL